MVWPPGTPSLKAKATRRRKQPMAKTDTILVVNAGSSSIKFSLYPAAPGDSAILGGGIVEGIGVAPQFKGRSCGRISEERWPDGRALDTDHVFGLVGKSVVWGKRVSVRIDVGGRRILKETKTEEQKT